MKPAPLTLLRPRDLAGCLAALDSAGDSVVKVIAGGQSLMPLLALRMSTPDVLVDVGRVRELTAVSVRRDVVELGARIRHRDLVVGRGLGPLPAVLATAAGHIGHEAIRNRGTLGGSLAHADPAAELPAAMVLLDAQIVCRSAGATRVVPAREFFLGPYMTALRDDELLTAVRIPREAIGTRYGFAEFSPRHGDYARAGALCSLRTGPGGTVRSVRAVLFAVGSRPVDVSAALAPALECRPGEARWSGLAEAAVADQCAGDRGRRRLAAVMLRRALNQASRRGESR